MALNQRSAVVIAFFKCNFPLEGEQMGFQNDASNVLKGETDSPTF